MPKYRYALDPAETIVDVLELVKGAPDARGPFRCAGCGDTVIPRLKADLRVKHFAHKVHQASCSEETYLHRVAKRTFVEVYQACLDAEEPFSVKLDYPKTCARFKELLGVRCRAGDSAKTYDLTVFFDGIREEKRHGQFIPDVLLFNRRDESKNIYIEIAVTHFLSDEKEASGQRIIEIPIETETDIEKIKARFLTERDARFVGFPRPTVKATDAECRCARHDFLCFMIFDSGKAFLERAPLSEIAAKRKKFGDKIRYVRLLPNAPAASKVGHMMHGDTATNAEAGGSFGHPYNPYVSHEPGYLFLAFLEEAKRRGFPVRNCYLCRYKGENYGWDAETGIFCKILKRTCNSNEAVGCTYFRPRIPPSEKLTSQSQAPSQNPAAPAKPEDPQAKRAEAKARQDELQREALEKARRDTEERIRSLSARADAALTDTTQVLNLGEDLPDGCLYRTDQVEVWREANGQYAVYTRLGVVETASNAHAAFMFLAEKGLLDTPGT